MWILLSVLLLSVTRACLSDGLGDDANRLQISRIIDDSYSQIHHHGVQELAGQNLTLSCDLFSANNTAYDDQIAWGKATQGFIFKNVSDLESLAKKKSTQMFAYFRNVPQPAQQEVNRAVKSFTPLREDDAGTYFCGSMKYMKFVIVYVVVKPRPAPLERNESGQGGGANDATNWAQVTGRARARNWKNLYCNERMFKCKSGGGCISTHYVCDRKPDCSDGSDESLETCKGDPCVDKLLCDDGRCIPTAWCCDKYLDANCSVRYRPPCCQLLLTDAFDEPEYFVPYNMTQPVRANGGRYIFITLCILATFFSTLLLLLILGKIFTLAKKARCREEAQTRIDACMRLNQHTRSHASIVRNYNYRARIVCRLDAATGVNDALLVLSDDILRRGGVPPLVGGVDRGGAGVTREEEPDECPPSYTDVMSLEPPPPYTSQDCLNR